MMQECECEQQPIGIAEEERYCIFCELSVDDGVALRGNLMKLAECSPDEWGHLECYLTYAVHSIISDASDYIIEGLKEKVDECSIYLKSQNSENAK